MLLVWIPKELLLLEELYFLKNEDCLFVRFGYCYGAIESLAKILRNP